MKFSTISTVLCIALGTTTMVAAAPAPAPTTYHGGSHVLPTCNPIPGHNFCDITTSCITTDPASELHCACRAGYKADNVHDDDTSKQARLHFVGQEYRVFVAPGVVCNTLCDHYELGPDSCQEVTQI